MTGPPQHPDDVDLSQSELAPRRLRVYVLWAGAIALIGLMIVLHVAGVLGAGSHG